jgi:uncharacterized protein (DUF433 family)
MELNEGEQKAIVGMFANGASIRELAEWYRVDAETIREILRPHVRLAIEAPKRGRQSSSTPPTT